jgi:hypothetical protein
MIWWNYDHFPPTHKREKPNFLVEDFYDMIEASQRSDSAIKTFGLSNG